MDRKNLMIVGGLIGFIICLFSAFMIISFGLNLIIDPYPEYNADNASFNNSTPESTAVSIARLNLGDFNENTVRYVYLTLDGKYWKVYLHVGGKDPYISTVTIDAKTLMSKRDEGSWRSLDELKAS